VPAGAAIQTSAAQTSTVQTSAVVPAEARAAIERGRELYKELDPLAAVTELEKAVELAPGWAEAHRFLGKLQLTLSSVWFGTPTVDQKRLAVATRELLKAHELDPNDADGTYWAGRALVIDERMSEAETLLREALRLDPKHGLAAKELGMLYATTGDVAHAEVALRRAGELRPDDDEIQFQLGLQLEAQDDIAGAIAAHLHALGLNPVHQGPRSRLVSLYQRQGNTDAADAQSHELERWKTFGDQLRAAMDRSRAAPREAGPMVAVAELYRSIGMKQPARDWFLLALQREPENAQAKQALAELGPAPAGARPMSEIPTSDGTEPTRR